MKELVKAIHIINLIKAKNKIDAVDVPEHFKNDEDFSKFLFRGELVQNGGAVVSAHLKAIKTQLGKVLNPTYENFKEEAVHLEFCKGITTFDQITKSINLNGGTQGDNYIASQNLYLSAISSFRKFIPSLYQGDLELSIAPLKLRLAIEIYFKNMIGFIDAKTECLAGDRKGEIKPYPLSIAELLNFFSNHKYKKYAKIPMSISIIKDINYWSNNLVHTGIISFPWQTMTAFDLLKPLFYTARENGDRHLEGFNYLDRSFKQKDLIRDLNAFLSRGTNKVEVRCLKRTTHPLEGAYYYPDPNANT
ncbi:hypothetical protein [Pseudomonas wadenswilerensis]|uniref:hypothetical protein n=1 Tax=Pseudomonas wadenswilerensis TaxID=1785161 RepID=UPI00215ECAD6|nr:hypothetical protein [Pseudomonas wadenswilerensis]UVM20038.1 hypothetical protein LOY45_16420 [Pseudomonas wadenswilerensis]